MTVARFIILIALVAFGVLGAYVLVQQAGPSVVTGTVLYLEDEPLPKNATIEMRLLNISLLDVESQVLSEQTIHPNGRNVPLSFSLKYRPENIDADSTYSVAARVLVDGGLAWVTTKPFPVITKGNPTSVEVVMTDVR